MPSSPPAFSTNNNGSSVLPVLHSAVSGSIGTLVSTWTLYPLSLVIARLQVQRQLRRPRGGHQPGPAPAAPAPGAATPGVAAPEHGVQAPDPDLPGTLPGLPPTPAPTSPPPEKHPPPSERAGTQEPTQKPDRDQQPPPTVEYAGIIDAFLQIWNSDGGGGLRALYTGLAQDAPKSVLDSFLFFLFYEWFRSLRLRSRRRAGLTKRRGLGVVEELAVGMAAGACSRSLTTPIANVVIRRQTATLVDPGRALGVREIVRSIREERGIAGFWSGYSATLVLTLNPALTFFLQEFLKSTFAEQTYDDPSPRLIFLLAATSKAVSSFVTYPFQIAKTRLQAGVPLDPSQAENTQSTGTDEEDMKPDTHATDDGGPESETENNKTTRTLQNIVRRSIFGTVAHIISSEGIASLYDGVGAELLKGFFSHGTTMLAKDVVHKLLFKVYLVTLGVLTELRKRRLRGIPKGVARPMAALRRAL
ncbi:mitochondrial carrier domain-containing protein [Nemania sp. FL0916]|nr:mitochondrial carrier domain-containing protein [Nemania sp. FL0916]